MSLFKLLQRNTLVIKCKSLIFILVEKPLKHFAYCITNSKFCFRTFLGRYSNLFYLIYNLKKSNRQLAVDHSTEIVIEGFPRSANTYTVTAFQHAQNNEVKIAHHLHVPAQIIRGIKYKIPVLVLIRNPIDAVVSQLLFDPNLLATNVFKCYVSFYQSILPFKDDILLVPFEKAINDLGDVVACLNRKLNRTYNIPIFDEDDVREINKAIDSQNTKANKGKENRSGRPSKRRNEAKKTIYQVISKTRHKSKDDALQIYNEFVSLCL